jgi:hypothetical protein
MTLSHPSDYDDGEGKGDEEREKDVGACGVHCPQVLLWLMAAHLGWDATVAGLLVGLAIMTILRL